MARGEMSASLGRVAARAETPVLPLVDVWRASPDRPLLPYLDEIGAFLPGERPLFVTPEAHAGPSVRVCVLIQNDAGVWSCRLHPFEFLKEAA